MAKYFGKIGYGVSEKTAPGVFEDTIVERSYYGDVVRNTARPEDRSQVLDNIVVSNSISIVADAYAYSNFLAIRYILWMGERWKVSEVDVQRPRLILRLGDVYNGPESVAPDSP